MVADHHQRHLMEFVSNDNLQANVSKLLRLCSALRTKEKPILPAQAVKLSKTANIWRAIPKRKVIFVDSMQSLQGFIKSIFDESQTACFVEVAMMDILESMAWL